MNLSEYEQTIWEIDSSERLTATEKHAALSQIANDIKTTAWQGTAKQRATEVELLAKSKAESYPNGGLDALNSLAAKGLLSAL